MKILFVAPEIPWPSISGGRLRTAALVSGLAKIHNVTVAAPISNEDIRFQCPERLSRNIAFVPLKGFLRPQPFPSGPRVRRAFAFATDFLTNKIPYTFRLSYQELIDQISKLSESYDAVFCRYTWLTPLLRDVAHDKIVLDADDINYVGLIRQALLFSHGWGSILLALESLRVYRFEVLAYRRPCRILVCSQSDKNRLKNSKVTVLKNGISVQNSSIEGLSPDFNVVSWVGMASYAPNTDGLRWFLKEVWPKLKSIHPLVRFKIFGRDADAKALPFAVGLDDVELVGPVPDSSLCLGSGLLSVVPLLNGTGTRIKILESLACGRAVVSTDVGAEGYDEILEEHGLFRARDARSMVEHISNLISSPERAIALAANGRRLVEMNYSWEVVTEHLARDFERWTRPERLQSRGAL